LLRISAIADASLALKITFVGRRETKAQLDRKARGIKRDGFGVFGASGHWISFEISRWGRRNPEPHNIPVYLAR
jgi:hypothetical protein